MIFKKIKIVFLQKTIKLLEKIHLKFFGHPISKEMKKFLSHLSWSFLGGIISAGIIFVINIIAGRILGPSEFGKYSLVIASAAIFVIFMTWGIDTAATFYIARSQNEEDKKKYFGSVLLIYLILVILSVVFLIAFKRLIVVWFKTDYNVVFWAGLFAFFSSFKNIADAFIKAKQEFKFQSFLRISEAFIIFSSFLIFIAFSLLHNFSDYIKVLIIGYAFFVLVTLKHFKEYLQLNWRYVSTLLNYGTFAVIGSFSGILLNSFDKILINKFLGPTQLGIYNAYSIVSVILIIQFVAMFINVFFPVLSSLEDKEVIFQKINKLSLILFIPFYFLLTSFISLAILLFGKQYPFDLILVLEFGALAVLMTYFTILWWLIASQGKEGIRFTSVNGIIAGLFFVLLTWSFGSKLNLHLVVEFLILAIVYNITIGLLGYKYSFWKIK